MSATTCVTPGRRSGFGQVALRPASASPSPAQAQGGPKPRQASADGSCRPGTPLALLSTCVDDVQAGEEEPILRGPRVDVHDVAEEVGAAVAALERLRDDRVMRAQVRAAREAYVHTWRLR